MKHTLPILLLLTWLPAQAQYIPIHPTNQVYEFLSELANENLIDISTAVKPYSHEQISGWLDKVDISRLNRRQQKELQFYKKDFVNRRKAVFLHTNGFLRTGKDQRLDLYHYNDSLFSISINPIGGGNYFMNTNGRAYHWWNGAGATATAGRWAFFGSLRDNHESESLTQPDFMNQNYGGANFKQIGENQIDYWEYRGGISYDFGMSNLGIYKDHFTWGSNYNGANIFSGRTHSFAHIAFNIQPVKWFEFRYIHGWLVSEVIDSLRSFNVSNNYGTDYREVYHKKYLAANFFTFKPVRELHLSFGNSIVYDYDNPHLAYFIPFMFYKAVDHHLSSGINNMNSQIFFDISTRLLPKTHIYTTLFLDELAVGRIFDPDEHNFVSSKTGIRVENPVPNVYLGAEYTWTNALAFMHDVPTTTFESNRFNLGHYLEDNAKELYLYLGFRPYRATKIHLSYTLARKGPDHTNLGTLPRMTIEPFDPIVWESDNLTVQFTWQVINDAYFRIGYTYSNVRGDIEYLEKYSPEIWWGKVNGLNVGLNYGF